MKKDTFENKNKKLKTFIPLKKESYLDSSEFGVGTSKYYQAMAKGRTYTPDEIRTIIDSGDRKEKVALSRHFYKTNGTYKRIINHYSTFLLYTGLVVPNVNETGEDTIESPKVSAKYYKAVDFVENMDLKNLLTHISTRVLVDGAYYGMVQSYSKTTFATIDLPYKYCRTRFKDQSENQIIEFDISYFDTITNSKHRREALSTYPEEVSSYYRLWTSNKGISKWVFIDASIGITFSFEQDVPFFLDVIDAVLAYEQALDRNAQKEIAEIKKIIVQKIPSTFSKDEAILLFEPDEALAIHEGASAMLGEENSGTELITTYADTQMLSASTSSDTGASATLDLMRSNMYSSAGASSQLFSAASNSALGPSLENDLALMMSLANKYSRFITNLLNAHFKTTRISFKYIILPVSWYNKKEYTSETLQAATNGYSFLLPAASWGVSQRDLLDLKTLEMKLLKLNDLLEPLRSSYTLTTQQSHDLDDVQSERQGKEGKKDGEEEVKGKAPSGNAGGRPAKDDSEKSSKTLENINAGG